MTPSTPIQPCPLCDGTSSSLLYQLPGLSGQVLPLYWCKPCGLAFMPQGAQPEGAYEKDYYYFRPWMEGAVRRLAQRRWRQIRPRIRGTRLLDVGCGQGFFLAAAKQAGMEVRGIEPNPQAAERARAEAGAEVNAAPLAGMAKWTGWADTVVSFDVIEHSHDPIGFMCGIAGMLAPDGVAIMETPNFGHLLRPLMGHRWYAFNPYHVTLFARRALETAGEKAALRCVRCETPHVGLPQAVIRLIYDVGLEPFLRIAMGGPRDDVYVQEGLPPTSRLRRGAGALVYRRGPLSMLIQALGWGDKLRAYFRKPRSHRAAAQIGGPG